MYDLKNFIIQNETLMWIVINTPLDKSLKEFLGLKTL